MTQLALFDLDHTLLLRYSDYELVQFLARIEIVYSQCCARQHKRFYQDYTYSKRDIHEFLWFALKPLAVHSHAQLKEWHDQFMEEVITEQLCQKAVDLFKQHQDASDLYCIVTATNSFVTRPVIERFSVEHLITTEPAIKGDVLSALYTGKVSGIPNFRDGKMQNLHAWLSKQNLSLANLAVIFIQTLSIIYPCLGQ